MSIEKRRITSEQKKIILAIEESHFVDLKAVEIKPAKLTKAIAAFANADGGELYVGIDEDKVTKNRTLRGFSNLARIIHDAVGRAKFLGG